MGRRPSPDRLRQWTVRLPEDVIERLTAEAEQLTLAPATAARLAIVEWLERRRSLRSVAEFATSLADEAPDLAERLLEIIAERQNR